MRPVTVRPALLTDSSRGLALPDGRTSSLIGPLLMCHARKDARRECGRVAPKCAGPRRYSRQDASRKHSIEDSVQNPHASYSPRLRRLSVARSNCAVMIGGVLLQLGGRVARLLMWRFVCPNTSCLTPTATRINVEGGETERTQTGPSPGAHALRLTPQTSCSGACPTRRL